MPNSETDVLKWLQGLAEYAENNEHGEASLFVTQLIGSYGKPVEGGAPGDTHPMGGLGKVVGDYNTNVCNLALPPGGVGAKFSVAISGGAPVDVEVKLAGSPMEQGIVLLAALTGLLALK
jgi:hypothetical protein